MLGYAVCVMAVFRIAVALVLIHHLAVARRSTSIYQKQLHVVASLNSINDDSGIKSSHKYPTCPLWKYHKYHNSSCICGSGIDNVVYCKDNQSIISIVPCYCMSYSNNGDGVVVGACPFLCGNYFHMDINSDTNLSTLCDRDIRQIRWPRRAMSITQYNISHYQFRLFSLTASNLVISRFQF